VQQDGGVSPVRQAEVAQAAGVSRAAVSQILSGNGQRFSEATRARVQQAARELAYEPSAAGRTLRRGTSDVVVAVIPNTTFGAQLQDILDELTADLDRDGLFVVARYSPAGDDSFGRFISASRPAAVLPLDELSQDHLEVLAARGARLADASSHAQREHGHTMVGALQAQHLVERGHRHLAYAHLSVKRSDRYGQARLDGVVRVCRRAGLPAPEIVTVPIDARAAVDVVAGLRATAVACYNDDVAVTLMSAARRVGRRVPDGLALIGVDHTALGQVMDPPLSTLAYDTTAIARALGDQVRTSLGLAARHPEAAVLFTIFEGGTS
jgi:DNA-binding LacI/PurR family transcriptional regulator